MNINKEIGEELRLPTKTIDQVMSLIDGGATIPFIARYRKEVTGGLDEVILAKIKGSAEKKHIFSQRKLFILKTLEDQQVVTPEIRQLILDAKTSEILEDIYAPYKKRTKTRADKARDLGLGEVAEKIWKSPTEVHRIIDTWTNNQTELKLEQVSKGVSDILAEYISHNSSLKENLRITYRDQGYIISQAVKARVGSKVSKDGEILGQKYQDYFDWKELGKTIPGHRFLAIMRGKQEGFLRVTVDFLQDQWLELFVPFPKGWNHDGVRDFWYSIGEDSWKRLIHPSLEQEFLGVLKERADIQAIDFFAKNIRALLQEPPYTRARVLAVDPGFRTGCKLAVIDEDGNVLTHSTMYPVEPHNKISESTNLVHKLISEFRISVIAIGNGTAGRETELFFRSIVKIPVILVDERGASVYSASETARREFPDLDLTVRGAISIGRRLQNPLAELVKIEPKSMGVGQYQHDINQKLLDEKLHQEVEFLVNASGVDVNKSGEEILGYVAGLNRKTVNSIIQYKKTKGPFSQRKELLNVPGLGEKAFQQCAGFLKIMNGTHPLDGTAIHPELYQVVEDLTFRIGKPLSTLLGAGAFQSIDSKILQEWKVKWFTPPSPFGTPTYELIREECESYGKTNQRKVHQFRDDVTKIDDLSVGMALWGKITNITSFGAFADIGIHQDGLIHISKLSDRFIKDPGEVISLGEWVEVKIIELDVPRKRISLARVEISTGSE